MPDAAASVNACSLSLSFGQGCVEQQVLVEGAAEEEKPVNARRRSFPPV
jgi:hypothetical protein